MSQKPVDTFKAHACLGQMTWQAFVVACDSIAFKRQENTLIKQWLALNRASTASLYPSNSRKDYCDTVI